MKVLIAKYADVWWFRKVHQANIETIVLTACPVFMWTMNRVIVCLIAVELWNQ